MDHVIKGKNTSSLCKLSLQQNEYVIANPEYMIAAQGAVRIMPFQKAGLLRNLADKFKGQSLALQTIHAQEDNTWLMLSAPMNSAVAMIDFYAGTTRRTEIFLRQDCLLAAHQNIAPDAALPRDIRAMAEWMDTDLVSLSGNGPVFIHGTGTIEHIMLQSGQSLCVDAQHLVAWETSITCHPVKSGSLLSLGQAPNWGENRKLVQLYDQGSVWLQTRST